MNSARRVWPAWGRAPAQSMMMATDIDQKLAAHLSARPMVERLASCEESHAPLSEKQTSAVPFPWRFSDSNYPLGPTPKCRNDPHPRRRPLCALPPPLGLASLTGRTRPCPAGRGMGASEWWCSPSTLMPQGQNVQKLARNPIVEVVPGPSEVNAAGASDARAPCQRAHAGPCCH